MNRELSEAVMAAAELFESHHWQYARKQEFHVPDVEELMHVVMTLIESINGNARAVSVRSGRFLVTKEEDGSFDIYLHLGNVR